MNSFIGHTGRITQVLECPEDETIISASEDGTVRVWRRSAPRNPTVFSLHTKRVNGILLLDEEKIASWSEDGTCRIWNRNSGRLLAELQHPDIRAASANGHDLITYGYDGVIRLWDVNSGECRRTFKGHIKSVKGVLHLRNGLLVSWGQDGTVRVWDRFSESSKVLIGHRNHVTKVFAIDERHIVSYCISAEFRKWDTETWECVERLTRSEARQMHLEWLAELARDDSGTIDRCSQGAFVWSEGSVIGVSTMQAETHTVAVWCGDDSVAVALFDHGIVAVRKENLISFIQLKWPEGESVSLGCLSYLTALPRKDQIIVGKAVSATCISYQQFDQPCAPPLSIEPGVLFLGEGESSRVSVRPVVDGRYGPDLKFTDLQVVVEQDDVAIVSEDQVTAVGAGITQLVVRWKGSESSFVVVASEFSGALESLRGSLSSWQVHHLTALILATAAHPKDASAYSNLGSFLAFRLRAWTWSELAYQRALSIDDTSAIILNNLGWVMLEAGKVMQAVDILRRATEIDSGFSNPYYWLAHALKSLGDETEERRCWEVYLTLGPTTKAREQEARARLAALNVQETVGSHAKQESNPVSPGVRRHDAFEKDSSESAIHPDQFFVIKANQLMSEQMVAEAETLLRAGLTGLPGNWKPVSVVGSKLLIAFWDQNDFLRYTKACQLQPIDAREKWESIDWVVPSYSCAYYLLAMIANMRHDYQAAFEACSLGLALEEHPQLMCEQALSLSHLGRNREALRMYERAFGSKHMSQSTSVQGRALRGQAVIYIDLRDFDRAENLLHQALQLEPGSNGAIEELSYLRKVRQGLSPVLTTTKIVLTEPVKHLTGEASGPDARLESQQVVPADLKDTNAASAAGLASGLPAWDWASKDLVQAVGDNNSSWLQELAWSVCLNRTQLREAVLTQSRNADSIVPLIRKTRSSWDNAWARAYGLALAAWSWLGFARSLVSTLDPIGIWLQEANGTCKQLGVLGDEPQFWIGGARLLAHVGAAKILEETWDPIEHMNYSAVVGRALREWEASQVSITGSKNATASMAPAEGQVLAVQTLESIERRLGPLYEIELELGHHLRSIDPKASASAFRRATETDPSQLAGWFCLAKVMNDLLGAPQDAARVLEEGIGKVGGDGIPWLTLNLGRVSVNLGRLDEANRHFYAAWRQRVAVAVYWANLVFHLERTRRDEDLIYVTDQVLAACEDAVAWACRGAACLRLGRVDAAVESYQKSLNLKPGTTHFRYGLARALVSASNTSSAIINIDMVLREEPVSIAAWCLLGVALANAAIYRAAACCYRRALHLSDYKTENCLVIRLRYALLCDLSGDSHEAALARTEIHEQLKQVSDGGTWQEAAAFAEMALGARLMTLFDQYLGMAADRCVESWHSVVVLAMKLAGAIISKREDILHDLWGQLRRVETPELGAQWSYWNLRLTLLASDASDFHAERLALVDFLSRPQLQIV